MKKNEIGYNSLVALNMDGWGIFDPSYTFNQSQREVGISKTLAGEITQNAQRTAQESIGTSLNPIYKLGEAVTMGVGGVIGSATTNHAKSPNNSPQYNVFKPAIKEINIHF